LVEKLRGAKKVWLINASTRNIVRSGGEGTAPPCSRQEEPSGSPRYPRGSLVISALNTKAIICAHTVGVYALDQYPALRAVQGPLNVLGRFHGLLIDLRDDEALADANAAQLAPAQAGDLHAMVQPQGLELLGGGRCQFRAQRRKRQ